MNLKLPKELLKTKARKEMWKEAKKIISKVDKKIGLKEAYVMGSFTSKKKRPADIDFAIIIKTKNNSSAWPIDLLILPDNVNKNKYLKDLKQWMISRNGKSSMVKLK